VARVNVDSQALTDARFAVLASLMGADDPDVALGRMIRVWFQCLERETYTLTESVIRALFHGSPDAPKWLVDSELAEPVEGGFRIRGTKGRIEYLAEQRARARQNGTKGGRPGKPTLVVGNNQRRGGSKTPPTPTPAPAPTLQETPIPPVLDTTAFREAWKAWIAHRQEIKKKLTPTTASKQLKWLAAMGEDRALRCVEHTIEKGWVGLREPDTGFRNGKPTLLERQGPALQAFVAGESA
jgi:hypothetical protein